MAEERDMPWRAVADGVELLVRAQPGTRRPGVSGVRATEQGMALVVGVNEAPEKGKANKAIVALLAKALRVPKSAVAVQRGERQRLKVLHICGAPEDIMARLRALTGEK